MVDEFSQVIRARVRPGTRVTEERHDQLRLLEVGEHPGDPAAAREAKSSKEEKGLALASDVEYFEKRWTKKSPESMDDIRRYVDGLSQGVAPPPTDRVMAGAPVSRTRFGPEIGSAPWTGVVEATSEEKHILTEQVGGEILRAQVVYRTARSKVVRLEVRRGERVVRTLATIVGETVANLQEIRTFVDGQPASVPSAPASAGPVDHVTMRERAVDAPLGVPGPVDAPAPSKATADETPGEEKKGRFGFFKRGGDKA